MLGALALLALFALVATGCRRPQTPKGSTPRAEAPAEENPAPAPGPLDEDGLLENMDVGAPDSTARSAPIPIEIMEETGSETEGAPTEPTPRTLLLRPKKKQEQVTPEGDLRSRLHAMRRSVDRRLLWARSCIDRHIATTAMRDQLVAQAAALELTTMVPAAPDTEALGALLQGIADHANLPLTELSFKLAPARVDRVPDVYSGDKPIDLTTQDLIGTIHISFVLGTEDKQRLEAWYQALSSMPRFLVVHRIRHTGASFQILAEAYYRADRKGPLRVETVTEIAAELERVGIKEPVEAVRQLDRDHFLLATEASLKELSSLIAQANEVSRLDAEIRRAEVIQSWYQQRLKARSDRSFSRLLR